MLNQAQNGIRICLGLKEKGNTIIFQSYFQNDETILCLHQWGEHEHPTMINNHITPGNGLILYLKTDNLEVIRKKADDLMCIIEDEIHINPNSLKKEFSLRDPDNYYIIVTEYHTF